MSGRFIESAHPQHSKGWHADRLGRLTGSVVADIFSKRKGETEARDKLRFQLALSRITGKPPAAQRVTADMKWGTAQEPFNRMVYEGQTGLDSRQCGFMYLPRLKAGCSVDGEVEDGGRHGFNEFKSPTSRVHYGYLEAGVLPADYVPQVTHNAWVTGYDFCDFQSFDPRLPKHLQVFRIRVERSALDIAGHERAVLQFLMEVDDLEDQMRRRAA